MVTASQVWAALAEIPDPEIPVISLVDLGVVRTSASRAGGSRSTSRRRSWAARRSTRCARDGGRDRRARRRARHPRRPRRLLVDRPDHRRRAARSSARRASRRPPRARPSSRRSSSSSVALPLPLVRLDRHAAREPLRPDTVPVAPLLQRAAASRSSSSRRSDGDEPYVRAANQPPTLEGYDLFSENRPLVEALRREGGGARSGARRSGGSAAASHSSSGGSRTSTRRSFARTTVSASVRRIGGCSPAAGSVARRRRAARTPRTAPRQPLPRAGAPRQRSPSETGRHPSSGGGCCARIVAVGSS